MLDGRREQRVDDRGVHRVEITGDVVFGVERRHRDARGEQLLRRGMAQCARVAVRNAFERGARGGEHEVDAAGPEPDDHDTPAHVVGVAAGAVVVVVVCRELRTAGTFGASTRYVFGFQVP